MEPAPDAVRESLCRLLGYYPAPEHDGVWRGPGERWLWRQNLPDPANDLNAMAAVEKAMTPDQLWDYAAWLAGASPGERGWQHEIDADTLVRVATAPAAVRALAAYKVLVAAKDE